MSADNVNLVPQEVRVEKKKSTLKRYLNLGSLAFLFITLAVAFSLGSVNLYQKVAINNARSNIIIQQKLLNSQLSVLQMVKDTEGRVVAVKSLLEGKQRYSKLLQILPTILPQGSEIKQFSTSPNKVQAVINATGVVDVAKFLKVVLDPAVGGNLFSAVELQSVQVDPRTKRCDFSITLTLKEGSLVTP